MIMNIGSDEKQTTQFALVSGKILQQQLWATAGGTKETAPALHLRTSAASSPASRR